MLGIFNAGLPLGQIAGMVIGGLLCANYGWRMPFFIFAPLGIAFGLLALLLKDYKTVKQNDIIPGNEFIRSIGYLLKIRTLRWYYLGMGFMTLMSLTSSWAAALIMRQTGCKEDAAGYFLGAVVAITVIGAVVGGRVGDIWVKKSLRSRLILPAVICLANPLITSAAVLALMSTAQGSGLATIGFIMYAIGTTATGVLYMVALPALTAANQEVVSPDRKGTSWGFAILSMFLIGGWAPLAIGEISDALGGDAWGLASGIIIVGMSGLVAAFCYYMSSRYFVQDSEKVKDIVIEG
jgi:MFS family permease